jgi:hypothetical protein
MVIKNKRQYNMKKIVKIISVFIVAAALAAAAVSFAWHKGAFLPRWIIWQEKEEIYGFSETDTENTDEKLWTNESKDESNLNQLKFILKNKRLELDKDNTVLWTSPKDILVQDFLWCDINHDNKAELVILCWRIGRYGNAKPYWVENDEHTWSQHIYIYELRDNEEIHPIWMASDIGMDVKDWSFDDIDRLVITETSGRRTSWDWVSWGLSLVKNYEG